MVGMVGKRYRRSVERLVAEWFLLPDPVVRGPCGTLPQFDIGTTFHRRRVLGYRKSISPKASPGRVTAEDVVLLLASLAQTAIGA